MGRRISGQALRAARVKAGISMRGMARRTRISYSHLSNVERGDRAATAPVVEAYRRALADKGHVLVTGGQDVRFREVSDLLRDSGNGLPGGAVPALTAAETVRAGLHDAVGRRSRAEWWQQAIADYGASHYLAPPTELLRDLLADAAVLKKHISDGAEADRRGLLRSAGYLAGVTAYAWSNLGERRQARRWWHTAIDAADQSEDPTAQVWVRAWAVANGPYIDRRLGESLTLARERLGEHLAPASASCALLSGLAQTQADLGDPAAVTTLRQLAELTERVPTAVAHDRGSLFGWPEVRLRYTESHVHTACGDTSAAYAAQDRALGIYHTDMPRDRARILLHRARCLVIDGDIAGGIACATGVLDNIDATVRFESVNVTAKAVLAAVPPRARKLAVVTALHDRLRST
ncbi:helix-turn-helix domain-containing protein [Nonomuraea antri]|uniref:helix-turn-helix domain-containing protein n=1 Tax=Nonomuraea antri TaxID=2730852 RepID=UPI001C2BA43B|nr:helix-turn-helix transcriptional regulator [Nonomuraea antri]